jgi:hypothetical protein
MPITIDNPAKLPGAFLFFTIKTASGSSFAGVAYDEKITKTTKLQELQQSYLSSGGAKLPYMERFTQVATDGTSPWQGKDNVTYGECSFQLGAYIAWKLMLPLKAEFLAVPTPRNQRRPRPPQHQHNPTSTAAPSPRPGPTPTPRNPLSVTACT